MLQGATADACLVTDLQTADLGIRLLGKDFTIRCQDVAPGGLGVAVTAVMGSGISVPSLDGPLVATSSGFTVIWITKSRCDRRRVSKNQTFDRVI